MTNARTQNKSYATEFTAAVATFARAGGDVPARIPEMLVNDFDAARAELWLWDQQSDCFYLTHTAGQEARHHLDYASAGTGAIGKFASSKSAAENVPLSSFGDDSPQFADAGGLGFVCAYPLVAAEQLSGVLVAYSAAEVPQDLLVIWRLYAGLSAVKLNDVLAAKEKDRRINQLSLMFEATRMLNSTLDLAELLELILKIASTELKADRGSVFLVDQKRNELWSIVASGLDRQEIRVPIGGGVAGRVASTGEVVNVNDAYTLSYFDPSFDLRFNYKTKSLLCVPIRHQVGGIVGVIQLLNAESGSFSAEDVAFLIELSGHIAMALENVRLHRDSIDKHLLERELSLARGIQRKLLPNAPPIVPGYEIAALRDFCYDVAGDYYDFLNLGPQSLLIVCAEVEGRGIASALLMAKLQATLQALVINLHSLEVLALSLNELLYQDTHAGKQLSLFMGLVDTRRNVLHYINAGHVPPILVRGKDGAVVALEDGGLAIGRNHQADYNRGSVKLHAGDILVCCTDGILKIPNEQNEEYGARRLAELVRRNLGRSAQAIVDAVLTEVSAFPNSSMNVDDKVLIVMKVTAESHSADPLDQL